MENFIYALLPVEIANEFTLHEALHYVAFKGLPTTSCTYHQEMYSGAGARIMHASQEYAYPFDENTFSGFPARPEYPKLPTPDILLKENFKTEDEYRAYKEKCTKAHEDYQKNDAIWDRDFEALLELPKMQLITALKEGKIKAKGQLTYTLKPEAAPDAWMFSEENENDEDNWVYCKNDIPDEDVRLVGGMYLALSEGNIDSYKSLAKDHPEEARKAMLRYETREQIVPLSAWRLQGIDWENSISRSPEGMFMSVMIDREELFSFFPLSSAKYVPIRCQSGFLFLDYAGTKAGQVAKSSRKGRPPKIDWDGFHVKMAALCKEGLPAKQEACIAFMTQWCKETYGQTPERSTIQQRVSKYYATMIQDKKAGK